MKEALCLVAQASSNELDSGLKGKPGDQSGSELNAMAWHSYPWHWIYRAKSESDREEIALFMEKAILNGFIGYDNNRNKRDTLYENLLSNGYDVEKIDTHCYCDCSALGFCAIYPITKVSFSHTDEDAIKCPKVRHYPYYMQLDGVVELFDKLEGEEYTSSSDNLLRGDILVSDSEHVAVWI